MSDKNISILADGLSDQGLVRTQNEDHIIVDNTIGLYLIADGLGGHQAGEVASRIAAEVITEKLAHQDKFSDEDPALILRDAIMTAHQTIRQESLKTITQQGMGSTVVVLWLPRPGSAIWLAHVGDSRAYLLRGVNFQPLTEDHTLFNQAQKAGLLGSDPSAYPPRSMLSQALGASEVIRPDITRIDLQAGDTLLLCSDGLTDMLPDEKILTLLSTGGLPNNLCQSLIQAALSRGGKDNVSVIVLQVRSEIAH